MANKRSPDWGKIRTAYEAGEGSYTKLASRFRVPVRTLEDRARKESWVKSRDAIRGETVVKTQAAIVERKVASNLSDLEVIDQMLMLLCERLDTPPKSLEGVANAIARLIQVRQAIAPPTADRLAEIAIAHGITPEDFVQALARKWQSRNGGDVATDNRCN